MAEEHGGGIASHLGGFKDKLGPLPVWAWGGILGIVVVAYMYYRSSHASTAAPAPAGDATDTTDSGSDGTGRIPEPRFWQPIGHRYPYSGGPPPTNNPHKPQPTQHPHHKHNPHHPHGGGHSGDTGKYYTVIKGDTLPHVSRKVYGHATPHYEHKIEKANGLHPASKLHPGEVLRIPR
jgi:nucleoid-associated protein YgaU